MIVSKKILLKVFLLLVLLTSSFTIIAGDDPTPEELHIQMMLKLKFNPNYTHQETKDNFLSNLSRDCKSFGYSKIIEDERISPLAILESYPKEIALKYFKENYKSLCYYGFSLGVKYLINDYKSKLEPIILNTILNCFKSKNSSQSCEAVEHEFFYADITPLLNNLCSKNSLMTFKKIYCEYSKVKQKRCDFYAGKSYNKCPEYQAHMADLESLHKQYFNSQCNRYKWTRPDC